MGVLAVVKRSMFRSIREKSKRWAIFASVLALTGPLVLAGATGTANAVCTTIPERATRGVPLCPPVDANGNYINSNPANGLPPCTPGYYVQSACNP
jgi:hypothetical protein